MATKGSIDTGIALLALRPETAAEAAITSGEKTHPPARRIDVPANQKWEFSTDGGTPSPATIELCLLRDIRDNAQYQSLAERSESRELAIRILESTNRVNDNIGRFSQNVHLMYAAQHETNRLLRKIAGEVDVQPEATKKQPARKPAKKRRR